MKRLHTVLILSALTFTTSCDVANSVLQTVQTPVTPSLTNEEVISGLKEALQVGIKNAVNLSSVTDGFYKNSLIKLPFPEDAMKVKEKALEWGLEKKVEEFEMTLNRAAEEAAKEALPIFRDAILHMSVQDGFAILNGGEGAATRFLKDNTTAKLTEAFSPKVKAAIEKVKLTNYWNPIITNIMEQ